MSPDVIVFPGGRMASGGAGWWVRTKERVRLGLGLALRRLGVPGCVRPVEIHDPVSGRTVKVSVGPLFTRIEIDGRDFYFDRFSGRFDGTGQGCT